MSYDEEFLLELHRFCDEGDYTDRGRLEKYVSRYSEVCEETNRVCRQLQDLLNRGMLMEAREFYASQKPPIQEQIQELSCEDFLQMVGYAGMVGLPEVPSVSAAVLLEYQAKVSESHEVFPLIQQFRKALAAKDSMGQLRLTRQICECLPKDREWRKTLEGMEEKLQQETMEQAKNAILQKDYGILADCLHYLQGEPWTHPVRPEVIEKIQRVLHEHDLVEMDKKVKACLSELDTLYREDFENNLEAMKEKYDQIDAMMSSEPSYHLDEEDNNQMLELRGIWNERWTRAQQERERQLEFFRQVEALEGALDGNGSPEKLDEIFEALRRTGLPIDEDLQHRYQRIREIRSVVRKRNRQFAFAVGVIILVAFAVATVMFTRYRHRSQQIEEFTRRIVPALEDSCLPSERVEEMLSEMEERNPWVKESPEFARFRVLLREKYGRQEECHAYVMALADELSSLYGDCEDNLGLIEVKLRELDELSLTPELEEVRQNCHGKHDAAIKDYLLQQERTYTALLAQIQEARESILKQELPWDCEMCQAAVKTIENLLSDIYRVPNVPAEVKDRYVRVLADFRDFPAKIYLAWTDAILRKYGRFVEGKNDVFDAYDGNPFREVAEQQKEIEAFAGNFPSLFESSDVLEISKLKGELQDLADRLAAYRVGFQSKSEEILGSQTSKELVLRATAFSQELPKCLWHEYEDFLAFCRKQVAPLRDRSYEAGSGFAEQLENVSRDYAHLSEVLSQTAVRIKDGIQPCCQMVFMESADWPGSDASAANPICYYIPLASVKTSKMSESYFWGKRVDMDVNGKTLSLDISNKSKCGPMTIKYGENKARENLWAILPNDEKTINAILSRDGESLLADHWLWLQKYSSQKKVVNMPNDCYVALRELMTSKFYRTDAWRRLQILTECLRDIRAYVGSDATAAFKEQAFVRRLMDLLATCEAYQANYFPKMQGESWMNEANQETKDWISLKNSYYDLWIKVKDGSPDADIALLKHRRDGHCFSPVGLIETNSWLVREFSEQDLRKGCSVWVWDSTREALVEVGTLKISDKGEAFVADVKASASFMKKHKLFVMYVENPQK